MLITSAEIAKLEISPAEMRAIYRTDFLAFAYAAFMMLYPTRRLTFEAFHEAIALILMNAPGSGIRQIINAPPRSLKSFLVSIAWPAFMLGCDPTYEIICCSYSQPLAEHLSSECRRLMESDWYRRIFPTRLARATADELRTTAGGARIARSVGSTLTGLGADALIIDDPLNANEAWSSTARRAVIQWFDGTLISRLNDKVAGAIIVVMQRLHQGDLTGHLLEKGGWEHLVLPAIAQREILIPIFNGCLRLLPGDALQEREDLRALARQKHQMSLQAFNAQYLQEPLPDKGNLLNPDWLKQYDVTPVRQPGDQVVQSWDTALKTGSASDYSACLTFLVHNDSEYYLIDVLRQKLSFTDLCHASDEQARRHNPSAILVEEHAAGIPLMAHCKARGLTGVIGRRPTQDKAGRMEGETPKLEAGCLILPKTAPWLRDFMDEYLAFPGGTHDDQMDALSQFLNWRAEASKPLFKWFWA